YASINLHSLSDSAFAITPSIESYVSRAAHRSGAVGAKITRRLSRGDAADHRGCAVRLPFHLCIYRPLAAPLTRARPRKACCPATGSRRQACQPQACDAHHQEKLLEWRRLPKGTCKVRLVNTASSLNRVSRQALM